jgi:REP element-mobilizing transposase RayT
MKQQVLFREKRESEFGGTLLLGKRHGKRPINHKIPLHHILKATNPFVLLRNLAAIEIVLRKWAKEFNIQIFELAIHADHIHLVIQARRENYVKWVRTVTSVIARKFKIKWRLRPYTRLVMWGRDFKKAVNYVKFNREEGDFILEAHTTSESFISSCMLHHRWATLSQIS